MGDVSAQRAVAYIRESTEEQGKGYSPDAQREAIRRFAEANELVLVGEYLDHESGWKGADGRADFQRLMADATSGLFDVVLVFHTSRFARNQADARRYKQLLREKLGIRVVSVTQSLGDDPNDPAAFLSESIHEVFDEYYSVALSFWTRSGLREKARQGNLVGTLPWGYVRDKATGQVVTDAERAELVRKIFAKYAEGDVSDRLLASWLNAQGARTRNGNPFSKDTVREMLVNAAYAGYITGRRNKDTSIKGNHPPIVEWELFERVQAIRTSRTTTLHPGRPSAGYALSKILSCERCGAPMHGSVGGRHGIRRYVCSSRKQHLNRCAEPIIVAEKIEEAVAAHVRSFDPPHTVKLAVIRRLKDARKDGDTGKAQEQQKRLTGQLERLKDLYIIGDLTKEQYTFRCQTLRDELRLLQPPPTTDAAEHAAAVLTNFALFWERETDAAERNRLLRLVFERVTVRDGKLASITPRDPFLPFFQAGQGCGSEIRERRDSNPRPPA